MTYTTPVTGTIAGRLYQLTRPAVHAWVPSLWCDCPDEPDGHWHRLGRTIYPSRSVAVQAIKSALIEAS